MKVYRVYLEDENGQIGETYVLATLGNDGRVVDKTSIGRVFESAINQLESGQSFTEALAAANAELVEALRKIERLQNPLLAKEVFTMIAGEVLAKHGGGK